MKGGWRRRVNSVARFCILLGLLAVLVLSPALADDGQQPGSGPMDPAFQGGPWSDLAMGTPNEEVAGAPAAGSVSVLYGTPRGLEEENNQYWTQTLIDGDLSEKDDAFGKALALGDFNGDSFMDLAVGVPDETLGLVGAAGAVNVMYGAEPGGLHTGGSQYLTQDQDDTAGTAEAGDHFGAALAVGDFDWDGYDDLAVGVPGQQVGAAERAGAVHIFFGSDGGLQLTGQFTDDFVLTQEAPFIDDDAGTGDQFGQTLAAGDFNGDGIADLAVGVPGEEINERDRAGAVNILYGGEPSDTLSYSDCFDQDDFGLEADANDLLGLTLAAGDFDGDGHDELAIGVPYEDFDELQNPGLVHVLRGSTDGLLAGPRVLHQGEELGGENEAFDSFGDALTVGDFDGDGLEDLAIGVPWKDWDNENVGMVYVVHGAEEGELLSGPVQTWRQDTDGVPDADEDSDLFGYALAAGDFDDDGHSDLAIGTPYEAVGNPEVKDAGQVTILYGSAVGLNTAEAQTWYQGKGIEGKAEPGDHFGWVLAASRARRPGHGGVPGDVYLPLVLYNHR
jgi:hypothetical protein